MQSEWPALFKQRDGSVHYICIIVNFEGIDVLDKQVASVYTLFTHAIFIN